MVNECNNAACEFNKIDHVHIKSEEYVDEDGYKYLPYPDEFYDRYKICENGDLIFTDKDRFNFSFVPATAIAEIAPLKYKDTVFKYMSHKFGFNSWKKLRGFK